MSSFSDWLNRLEALDSPMVLEIGTKGWDGKPPVHHRDLIMATNTKAQWLGLDTEAGPGVDIVCDTHRMGSVIEHGSYDAMLCCSVLEHLRRPWVAAVEMAKILKPGGMLFIQTHQSFPLHGYPNDYFRFSKEAIGEVFAADCGWVVVSSEYNFPCKVMPMQNTFTHAKDWNFAADAWLNTEALIERSREWTIPAEC